MRIVIAPDKFKGSSTASDAARAIKIGLQKVWPKAQFCLMPVADGGEGTAEIILAAKGGEWRDVTTVDSLHRPLSARYAWLSRERVAVIDMSATCGLHRLAPSERDLLAASTRGVGEMILSAAGSGARTIIVGLGGSGTNDGGIGMAAALGYEFMTSDGEEIDAIPANLLALTRINPSLVDLPEVVGACDVRNPLVGPRGATRTYATQKGGSGSILTTLEESLINLADVAASDLGSDYREEPGSGAAGGLGFGLMTFCGARLRAGFDVIAEAIGLEAAIAGCDIVFTGEGSVDSQTIEGKAPAGVAGLARKYKKPVVAFAGSIEQGSGTTFDAVIPLADRPMCMEESAANACALLSGAAERCARLIQVGVEYNFLGAQAV